eukprot:TRINITY_DN12119_c0_g1_i1.p1 TRINITY_DN12119_c0_g1~~TRINITY_DN12119_c0_g1_i1.p1  ORF type:complete len:447 (+),score=98.16 TRINITY_DN12119_c0_g1_i1:58-1398(+)
MKMQEDEQLLLETKLYAWRWLILFSFGLASAANASQWIVFSPIAPLVERYYNTTSVMVNGLSMSFMVVYVPGSFIAAMVVDRTNLRFGASIGACLSAVGAIIRMFPYPFLRLSSGSLVSFVCLLLGQVISAIAQTFLLALPPLIAQSWFGDKERVTATAIGAVFNQIGIALGFILGPSIVNDSAERLPIVLCVQAGCAVVACVCVLALFRSAPETPPSASAQCEHTSDSASRSIRHSLRELFRVHSFWFLLVAFGLNQGAMYAFSTLLGYVLSAEFYSDDQIGILGVLLVAVGIVGAFAAGLLADRLRRYRLLNIVGYIACAASFLWFVLATVPDNYLMLCFVFALLGFFATAVIPLGMDLAVELTYPLPEALVTSLLLCSSQLCGIVLIVSDDYLARLYPHAAAQWFLFAVVAVAVVPILFVRVQYKRLNIAAPILLSTEEDVVD